MENAILIGLSRQVALQRQMDIVANNLANIETAGYKGEKLLFEEYLSKGAKVSDVPTASSKVSLVHDTSVFRQFAEGSIVPTDNPLDVALNGKGWLVVDTPNGERYTRNGHLTLNAEGTLVNGSGYVVRSTSGTISFGADETKITISADGTVSSTAGEKGKLQLVQFANQNALQKEGKSLFSSTEPPEIADKVRVVQGMIERSNVQPVLEMTRMIEVTRSYTAISKLAEKLDELKRRGIEQLGTLS